MVPSSVIGLRRILTLGLTTLAFPLVACDSPNTLAPEVQDSDLVRAVAQGRSERALEVKSNFVASLSGMGAGTDSRGAGEAVFRFVEGSGVVRFRLNVANIENVTMAHIHVAAAPGGNGPPAVWLYPDGPPGSPIPGRTQGGLGVGEFSAANLVGPLAGMTLADLREAFVEGRAYVNVHTNQYPGGEIRGTIG